MHEQKHKHDHKNEYEHGHGHGHGRGQGQGQGQVCNYVIVITPSSQLRDQCQEPISLRCLSKIALRTASTQYRNRTRGCGLLPDSGATPKPNTIGWSNATDIFYVTLHHHHAAMYQCKATPYSSCMALSLGRRAVIRHRICHIMPTQVDKAISIVVKMPKPVLYFSRDDVPLN
jgi:hypothetical protein